MKKKVYLTATVFITSCMIGMTAYAGDINGNESSVIGAASGVFIYGGEQYVATSEAMGMLYAKLSEDGVDLSAEQAAELISLGYANIGVGVQMGYLVSIGSVETEPQETEWQPTESETEPAEEETPDPHNQEETSQSEQESGKEDPESEIKKETDPDHNQEDETEKTGKQNFVDRLVKRMRKEKNPSEEKLIETQMTEETTESQTETQTTEGTAESQTETQTTEGTAESQTETQTTEGIAANQTETQTTEGITESDFTSKEQKVTARADDGIKEDTVADHENVTENDGTERSESNEQNTGKKATEENSEKNKDEKELTSQEEKNTQQIQDSQSQKNQERYIQEDVKKKIPEINVEKRSENEENQTWVLWTAAGTAIFIVIGLLMKIIQKRKDKQGRALCKEKRLIDIHCHILPDVDDGSHNMQETIEMLKMAEQSGTGAIIATVHYKHGTKQETENVRDVFEQVRNAAKQHSSNIQLYLGHEIYYTEDTLEDLDEKRALTLAESRYVLIEFLPSVMYSEILNAVRKLKMAGYLPILAHIERYECLMSPKGETYLKELKSSGAYFQINGRTLERRAQKRWCEKCLKKYNVDFIASDGHNRGERSPKINFAAGWITRKFGYQTAETIFVKNPQKILEGRKMK